MGIFGVHVKTLNLSIQQHIFVRALYTPSQICNKTSKELRKNNRGCYSCKPSVQPDNRYITQKCSFSSGLAQLIPFHFPVFPIHARCIVCPLSTRYQTRVELTHIVSGNSFPSTRLTNRQMRTPFLPIVTPNTISSPGRAGGRIGAEKGARLERGTTRDRFHLGAVDGQHGLTGVYLFTFDVRSSRPEFLSILRYSRSRRIRQRKRPRNSARRDLWGMKKCYRGARVLDVN